MDATQSQEVYLDEENFIVSKADTKGIITYVNRVFMDIAKYDEMELLGKNHNIIRHIDMPKIVFKMLWDTIKSNKEFIGFIKNKTKNGNYYWVFTVVAPSFDSNNKLIGYISVRRKPSQDAIKFIIPLYKNLIEEESQHTKLEDKLQASEQLLSDFLSKQNTNYNDLMLNLQGI